MVKKEWYTVQYIHMQSITIGYMGTEMLNDAHMYVSMTKIVWIWIEEPDFEWRQCVGTQIDWALYLL